MLSFNTFNVLAAFALMATHVSGHGYISKVSADGGGWQKAQKSGHSASFREVPNNTGWIGSKFLDSKAIVCGSSDTPFKTVAAPGGTFFSDAGQAGKQTLDVKAGGKITVVVSGNPGEGFPHPRGHVQTYLAWCGESHDACQNFDASQGNWFKILSEKDGIPNTLRKHMRGDLNGQTYDISIPGNIKSGSYILRYELIAFGQSSGVEGNQDQYYPFCGQIFVNGGASSQPNFKTVKFPGAYGNGNIDPGSVPGPGVMELASGGSAPPPPNPGNGTETGNDGGNSCGSTPAPGTSAPSCATMCFGVKITEHAHLAPNCGPNDVQCMCEAKNFKAAFENCSRDHCGSETSQAISSFDGLCAGTAKMVRRAAKRAVQSGQLAKRDTLRVSTLASRGL